MDVGILNGKVEVGLNRWDWMLWWNFPCFRCEYEHERSGTILAGRKAGKGGKEGRESSVKSRLLDDVL